MSESDKAENRHAAQVAAQGEEPATLCRFHRFGLASAGASLSSASLSTASLSTASLANASLCHGRVGHAAFAADVAGCPIVDRAILGTDGTVEQLSVSDQTGRDAVSKWQMTHSFASHMDSERSS